MTEARVTTVVGPNLQSLGAGRDLGGARVVCCPLRDFLVLRFLFQDVSPTVF